MVRFHLDEHVDPAVARALRAHGYEVTTTNDEGLGSSDDESQLAFAVRAGSVFVTFDADFLRFHAQRIEHCGIAFGIPGTRSLGEMIRCLVLIAECLTPEDMRNHVEFL